MSNVPGGGPRWLDVAAERFPGWVSAFAVRHGSREPLRFAVTAGAVSFTAADGAVAQCHPPFPESFAPPVPAGGDAGGGRDEIVAAIAGHARAPRAVGVLLVRLGGYAAGVFTGYPPALADAKTGSRLVHGRSAAGGWSQQRFARRRDKQASEALAAAADAAVTVFGRWASGITATGAPPRHPAAGEAARGGAGHARSGSGTAPAGGSSVRRLDAVVLGGDKRAAAELRSDPRLAPYLALATERFLTVPDPKRAVLEGTPKLFTAVRIRITEPPA